MKTKIEYVSISDNGVNVITEQEAKQNKTENIYYLEGVREDLDYSNGQRAKDEDVILKDMFVLDLDIRNNFEEEVSNEDIIKEGENFAEYLEDEDEYFGEWSKIVFTGNGLHIYYKGKPKQFNKEEYSSGVERIYRKWDEMMGAKVYSCDHACKNLARILRLPGSINQKNGAEVFTIIERKKRSRLFDLLGQFAKKELEERKEEEEKKRVEIEERIKSYGEGGNDFYEQILSIPAYEIAQKLIPEFPYDGKKNFKNKKGGFTGYFYNNKTNTICNGGSRYFNWGSTESCWDSFTLIKKHYNFSNKETFNFFKKLLGKK